MDIENRGRLIHIAARLVRGDITRGELREIGIAIRDVVDRETAQDQMKIRAALREWLDDLDKTGGTEE